MSALINTYTTQAQLEAFSRVSDEELTTILKGYPIGQVVFYWRYEQVSKIGGIVVSHDAWEQGPYELHKDSLKVQFFEPRKYDHPDRPGVIVRNAKPLYCNREDFCYNLNGEWLRYHLIAGLAWELRYEFMCQIYNIERSLDTRP